MCLVETAWQEYTTDCSNLLILHRPIFTFRMMDVALLSWWLTAGKGQNQGGNKSPQSQLSLACENVQQMTLVFANLHAMSQFSSFCLFKFNLLHENLNLFGSSCYVASYDATATSDLVIERVQCKYVNISVIWCTDGKLDQINGLNKARQSKMTSSIHLLRGRNTPWTHTIHSQRRFRLSGLPNVHGLGL